MGSYYDVLILRWKGYKVPSKKQNSSKILTLKQKMKLKTYKYLAIIQNHNGMNK